ncbi:MAG TPA: GDSL-type esterase/lipase family protein [Verrucomicrobiota bacterium]|nr:GDSL-type esterase/lipase family protein [Verrucomicrobiota bacterium]
MLPAVDESRQTSTVIHLCRLHFLWLRLGLLTFPSSLAVNAAEGQPAQSADGQITFTATAARIDGTQARLQSPVGRAPFVGSWTNPSDSLTWDFKPTRWGRYDLGVTYAAEGGDGTELQFDLAGKTFTVPRPSTGGWDRFTNLTVARIYLPKSDPFSVRLSCPKLVGSEVLRLQAVNLQPAPEGDSIRQATDGGITLPASAATTHSVMMRYEPATNKNCLGYWVNPSDWASWDFLVTQAGAFDVEAWQGCGDGQGGSDVVVEVGGQQFRFTVEETGHFQNFVPRRLGRVNLAAGTNTLTIKPKRKQAAAVMDIRQVRLTPATTARVPAPAARAFVPAPRVVLLGDSITYAGEWAELVETWLQLQFPDNELSFLNLGLPSETVSGLSEPGHAGGAFPRPELRERLGRVLDQAKPDLIVACYGMNDGIYYPFSEERLKKFQEGIRQLRVQAARRGVRVIHLSPPVFDPVPLAGRTLPAGLDAYPSPYEGYNTVLDRYSDWLISQRAQGWEVVDIHGPMNRFLEEQRRGNPKFILAGDGVHANPQGHWLIAREVLRHLGAPEALISAETPAAVLNSDPRAPAVLALVQQRQRALKDAWLTSVGHVRPGMSPGRPLPEAEREATEVAAKLKAGR